MRDSIDFANDTIEKQRHSWETEIKGINGGVESLDEKPNGSVERILLHPEVFLARIPRKSLVS